MNGPWVENLISTLFEIPKFRRFIDQKKPDIVHAQSRLPAWVAISHGHKSNLFKLGS